MNETDFKRLLSQNIKISFKNRPIFKFKLDRLNISLQAEIRLVK